MEPIPLEVEQVREILRAISDPPENVYRPSDDSFLMLDVVGQTPRLREMDVLDVGTGSGILGLFCATQGAHVTVTDIDQAAVDSTLEAANRLGVRLTGRVSDLFTNIDGKFDLILFNPPYLPSPTIKDRTVDGGPNGIILIKRFIEGLPERLRKDGSALLLTSTLNDVFSLIDQRKFDCEKIARRSFFFEELEVSRLRLREDLASDRFDR